MRRRTIRARERYRTDNYASWYRVVVVFMVDAIQYSGDAIKTKRKKDKKIKIKQYRQISFVRIIFYLVNCKAIIHIITKPPRLPPPSPARASTCISRCKFYFSWFSFCFSFQVFSVSSIEIEAPLAFSSSLKTFLL